jgi:hypothetical protein
VVFVLAFFSFACLLGQFYGLWTMRMFGCTVLVPSCFVLAFMVWASPAARHDIRSARTMIVEGAIGGCVSAVAYDLYRLPFVLNGAPLFKVFPKFGEMLLGATEPRWLVQVVGWTYHFSNGAALGIMFLALAAGTTRRALLFWGAVAWAVFIETMLLLTPYAAFFGLPLNGRFIFLTASAHAIFGIVLGIWCSRRLGGKRTAMAASS